MKTIHLLWLFVSLFTFLSCSSEIEGDEDGLLIGNDFANHEDIENKFDYSQLDDVIEYIDDYDIPPSSYKCINFSRVWR